MKKTKKKIRLGEKIVKSALKKDAVNITDDKDKYGWGTDKEIKGYNPITASSKFKWKYWKYKIMDKYWPHKTVLVNMELINGFHKLFLVKESDSGFKYDDKKYIFDSDSKYYIIDAKLWCYDFHESIDLPIKRIIPVTEIKRALEHSQLTEVEYATNPATLERFIVARIAEGIMKGQQLDEALRRLLLVCIIAAISSTVMLILFVVKSGMLKQIKIPGMG